MGENAMTSALHGARARKGDPRLAEERPAHDAEDDLQEDDLQDQDEIAQDRYDDHSVPAMLSKIDQRLSALEDHFKIAREG